MEENDPWHRRAGAHSLPAVVDVQKAREQLVGLLPRLRRFARALARNLHDADDLVQAAIERALARSDQLRAQSHPLHWMLGIVRSAWSDGVGIRRGATPAGPRRAPESPEARELLSLQEALARLPEEQHLAIALVLVEGLSYREAAELASVPVPTLTARLLRARSTLQGLLAAGTRR